MGFWHTGYMEHHEEDFFGSRDAGAAPVAPSFACEICGATFATVDALRFHRFDGHTFRRPRLLLSGRECGRSRQTVGRKTDPADWLAVDCELAVINGARIDPGKVGSSLSKMNGTVAVVELVGDGMAEEFELEIAVPELDDLDGVDQAFVDMVVLHQLSASTIDRFLSATARFLTAAAYRAGVASYLFGVLARERSPESGLKAEQYREKFDEAAALLGHIDRPAADAICALVAFHYNQLSRAISRSSCRASASRRHDWPTCSQDGRSRTSRRVRPSAPASTTCSATLSRSRSSHGAAYRSAARRRPMWAPWRRLYPDTSPSISSSCESSPPSTTSEPVGPTWLAPTSTNCGTSRTRNHGSIGSAHV